MSAAQPDINQLLADSRDGDDTAFATLFSAVYGSLRQVAQNRLNAEFGHITLSATALINETYLKLFSGERPKLADREHLIAITSNAMRQVLVDYARKRNAAKRPQAADRIALTDLDVAAETEIDVVALDAALTKLSELDEQQAKVVELKFFGGLTVEEIASMMNVSVSTIVREWRIARAWLQRELES